MPSAERREFRIAAKENLGPAGRSLAEFDQCGAPECSRGRRRFAPPDKHFASSDTWHPSVVVATPCLRVGKNEVRKVTPQNAKQWRCPKDSQLG